MYENRPVKLSYFLVQRKKVWSQIDSFSLYRQQNIFHSHHQSY